MRKVLRELCCEARRKIKKENKYENVMDGDSFSSIKQVNDVPETVTISRSITLTLITSCN
jgi:hypothetical protein